MILFATDYTDLRGFNPPIKNIFIKSVQAIRGNS